MRCVFPVKACFRKSCSKDDSWTHSKMKICKVISKRNIKTFCYITSLKVALTCWAVPDFEKKGLHLLVAAIKSFTNHFSVSDDSASFKTQNSLIRFYQNGHV